MSRERPERWSELMLDRYYWYCGDVVCGNDIHECTDHLPPDLLLVPTRAEWEATQRKAIMYDAFIKDAVEHGDIT